MLLCKILIIMYRLKRLFKFLGVETTRQSASKISNDVMFFLTATDRDRSAFPFTSRNMLVARAVQPIVRVLDSIYRSDNA